MYKVSIIIPVFNVQQYIEKSLLSALNQDFTNIEYIIVDDCGSDNSMEIVYQLVNMYSHKEIKIIKHPFNKGLSEARNTGLSEATGKFIFFMDSDDIIQPDCISKHYACLNNVDADFTIANINLVGSKSVHIRQLSKKIEYIDPFKTFLLQLWSTSAWNKLYNKEFIVKNNLKFIPNIYFEDIIWSFNAAMCAKRIIVVEDYTYNYIIHKNSITTQTNNLKKINSLMFIIEYLINIKEKTEDIYTKEMNRYINFWRFNTALLLLNFEGTINEQRKLYTKIQDFENESHFDLYNIILKLPYKLFRLIIRPIYLLYKYLQR